MSVKKTNRELVSTLQGLELGKESARISYNATISAMEDNYEEIQKQTEKEVQELRNELSSVKKSSKGFVLKIQNLEIDKESARMSYDAVITAFEENCDIYQQQYENEVQSLKDIVKQK